jgi:magnesium transporter
VLKAVVDIYEHTGRSDGTLMVAGIYGMNFDHMPELRWTWGYPTVLAVIASVCVFLYMQFRRNGWL